MKKGGGRMSAFLGRWPVSSRLPASEERVRPCPATREQIETKIDKTTSKRNAITEKLRLRRKRQQGRLRASVSVRPSVRPSARPSALSSPLSLQDVLSQH